MAMATYLSSVAADYTTTTLNITPQVVMTEAAQKTQVPHEADDGSVTVVTFSNTSKFIVSLQWEYILEADSNTIFDFWNDPAKGNGIERTFYWAHPMDTYTYTVRFWSDIVKGYRAGMIDHNSISEIQLKVMGVKP